jgi:AraC-like DNA-binding protein
MDEPVVWLNEAALSAWVAKVVQAAPLPPPGVRRYIVDGDGRRIVSGGDERSISDHNGARFLMSQTLQWGEPYWQLLGEDGVTFAVPLTWNERVVGGMMVEGSVPGVAEAAGLRSYASALVEYLERSGAVNGALLRENRARAACERARAEAIHQLKEAGRIDFRRLYCTEEPELLMAMQRGDRPAARRALNTVLVVIYNQAASNLTAVKRLIGELVLLMQRAMLECGMEAHAVLLPDFDPFTRLREVVDEEGLSEWTRTVLDRLMDASAQSSVDERRSRMQLAMRFMREHLDEALQRDEVARRVGFSPSHFTQLLKRFYGGSFSTLLTRLRLEKAVELLRGSSLNLQSIAVACGFQEQAYFTRVFRKRFGVPPGVWRRQQKNS